jgi:hypothetical protein
MPKSSCRFTLKPLVAAALIALELVRLSTGN